MLKLLLCHLLTSSVCNWIIWSIIININFDQWIIFSFNWFFRITCHKTVMDFPEKILFLRKFPRNISRNVPFFRDFLLAEAYLLCMKFSNCGLYTGAGYLLDFTVIVGFLAIANRDDCRQTVDTESVRRQTRNKNELLSEGFWHLLLWVSYVSYMANSLIECSTVQYLSNWINRIISWLIFIVYINML